jgi:hypothetical protein
MKTTLGSTAGNVLIGADLAASLTNITALLNAPLTTTAQGVALSTANAAIITDDLRIGSLCPNGVAVVATATTVTIVAKGSSRLTLSETAGNASWTKNYVHCYYGQKGAIDVAVQDNVDMEMRDEPRQRTTNIFCDCTAAVKTFTDGSQYFLDVHIANA